MRDFIHDFWGFVTDFATWIPEHRNDFLIVVTNVANLLLQGFVVGLLTGFGGAAWFNWLWLAIAVLSTILGFYGVFMAGRSEGIRTAREWYQREVPVINITITESHGDERKI